MVKVVTLFVLSQALVPGSSSFDNDADASLELHLGSDRGFLRDPELEQWLSNNSLAGCSVPKLKKTWDQIEPRFVRYKPVKSHATWADFRNSLSLPAFRSHMTGTSNQGRLGQYVNTSAYMDEMHRRQPTEKLGLFNQSHGEAGILGLEKSIFEFPTVAPEYIAMLQKLIPKLKAEARFDEVFDIMAASRHGLNFHAHNAFWFVPMRGKKLFILAPSGRTLHSLRNGEVPPEGLRFKDSQEGSLKQLALDLRILPSIVLLQKYKKWFTETPGLQICLVQEGDVLMVPEQWWHLTLSVGDSLSFSASFKSLPETKGDEKKKINTCPRVRKDLHDWDETTHTECVVYDPKTRAEICRAMPPPPSASSTAPTHLCDVIYRFLSWKCAEGGIDSVSASPNADAILRDASRQYAQASVEGGRETAEVFAALTTVWAQVASGVGSEALAADLHELVSTTMDHYQESTQASIFSRSDSIEERLGDVRNSCGWVLKVLLSDTPAKSTARITSSKASEKRKEL